MAELLDVQDYLFLGPLIKERVKAQVPGLVHVDVAPDIDYVIENMQQYTPAAYVIYLGDSTPEGPGGQGGARVVQQVQQHWAILLYVATADATGGGEEARRIAGPLLGKLMQELMGWQPAQDTRPLARASRQSPVVYGSGFTFFPLVFSTQFTFPRHKAWAPGATP